MEAKQSQSDVSILKMSENMSAIAADSFPNIYLPRVVLDKIDIPENSIIISTIIEDPSLSDGSTGQSSVIITINNN